VFKSVFNSNKIQTICIYKLNNFVLNKVKKLLLPNEILSIFHFLIFVLKFLVLFVKVLIENRLKIEDINYIADIMNTNKKCNINRISKSERERVKYTQCVPHKRPHFVAFVAVLTYCLLLYSSTRIRIYK